MCNKRGINGELNPRETMPMCVVAQTFKPIAISTIGSNINRLVIHLKMLESLFIFHKIVPVGLIVSGHVIRKQFRIFDSLIGLDFDRHDKEAKTHDQHYHHQRSPLHVSCTTTQNTHSRCVVTLSRNKRRRRDKWRSNESGQTMSVAGKYLNRDRNSVPFS